MELYSAKGAHDSALARSTDAAGVGDVVFVGTVRENLAVKEGEVVGCGALEALVRVCV